MTRKVPGVVRSGGPGVGSHLVTIAVPEPLRAGDKVTIEVTSSVREERRKVFRKWVTEDQFLDALEEIDREYGTQ